MGPRLKLFLLIWSIQILITVARTNDQDTAALKSLKDNWQNTPPNWVGYDPCGDNWEGIQCSNQHITSIVLSGIGLTGILSADIQYLPELRTLDLSQNKGLRGTLTPSIGNLTKLVNLVLTGCSFHGPIPDAIGSLERLVTLSLNSNRFSGPIPAYIGNLLDLFLLDLTDNELNGTIPVSNGISPGLDMLENAKHFHLGKNRFSGLIPPRLFSSRMKLIHVLFDHNQFTGSIPTTLERVQTLQVIRLDSNSISGTVDLNFRRLIRITDIYLLNNQLTGPIPDLTGLNLLAYVDMSNNSFDVSKIPPWFSSLESLTSLIMEQTQLEGSIPVKLFSLPELQSVNLTNNMLSGTLDIGTGYGNQLEVINLKNNSIKGFVYGTGYNKTLNLENNPICERAEQLEAYCFVSREPNSSYTTPANKCEPIPCSSGQIASPNCNCAYPIVGTLLFRSITFSSLRKASYYMFLQASFSKSFVDSKLPIDSISVSIPFLNENSYLQLMVQVFPSGKNRFNRTEFSIIASQLNNITFVNISKFFGPFYFTIANNDYFSENKSSHIGIIIGAAVGGSILLVLLLIAGAYAFHQRKRAQRAAKLNNPFASWDPEMNSGSRPEIKGVRCFSFEELKKFTNNFSDANILGSGGYGQVYKGTLENGSLVAIKRAKQGSMQGSLEFKSEIELLSRIHHRNVVNLLGFCYELGEQILVYEFIENGTLKESLAGKSEIALTWMRRLEIALDAARGLAYLHELANPPIIHRDIKSSNILLDDHLVGKVADFGISKTVVDNEKDHITTQIKGTLGYMDPEYFTTQQLTEKSDVYSFGVVMLELITGRSPIEQGKNIVEEVKMRMDRARDLYDLHEILDLVIYFEARLQGLEKFVDLAMMCVEEMGANRPTMSEVVKEIESILKLVKSDSSGESLFAST